MNDPTPTLLARLDGLALGAPPVDTLLTAGQVARRRRRRTAVAGTVAVTVLVIGGGAVAGQLVGIADESTREDVATADALEPPAGTRLVGLGRVAVAVPDDWDANAASCNTPLRDTYYFPHPQDCQSAVQPEVSSIAISTGQDAGTTPLLPDIQRDGTVGGHDVLSSGVICTPQRGEPCFEVFGIRDLDVWFTVRVPRGESAADTIEAIRDSLTVLPGGYTTVPFVPYGTEAQVAEATEEAGLSVDVEYIDCPDTGLCVDGVSDISPAVGTALTTGSTVTVTVIGVPPTAKGDETPVGRDRGLAVGETGPMTLWLHCGLEYVMVGDEVWEAADPQPAALPHGWPEQLPGTATRTDTDTITFVSDQIDDQIVFHPYEPTEPGADPSAFPEEAVCY